MANPLLCKKKSVWHLCNLYCTLCNTFPSNQNHLCTVIIQVTLKQIP